jgi:hypothetical protein
MSKIKRRDFIKNSAILGTGVLTFGPATFDSSAGLYHRKYHMTAQVKNPAVLADNPELLKVIRDEAGITDIWLNGYFGFGARGHSPEEVIPIMKLVRSIGFTPHIMGYPFGHPDAMYKRRGIDPFPPHWKKAMRLDGSTYSGVSFHPPADEENIQGIRQLHAIGGMKEILLDDDFRLSWLPGYIGGCFCDEHRRQFLELYGFNESHWNELLDAVKNRKLNTVMRAWINFTCNQLTDLFRRMQKAARDIPMGIMVMHLGAEKAGIRLSDYNGHPMRVGEHFFNDETFAPVKGKTDELFGSLFHRLFVAPDISYSETTGAGGPLSARNRAAKLSVSLLSDVRNTLFMGRIPDEQWDILIPAMKKSSLIHSMIAGHKQQGPFKHYWGEYSRWIGDDNPYSLFLAAGVPFEVTEKPADNGWTFLSEFDAQAVSVGDLYSNGTTFICRPDTVKKYGIGREVPESMEDVFAFKHQIMNQLDYVPIVLENKPVVCSWYPTARSIVLWNLSEDKQAFTVKYKESHRSVILDGLDVTLLQNIS